MLKNPARKAEMADCGIIKQTIKATIAILHQGKNVQIAKLNMPISKNVIRNFISNFSGMKIHFGNNPS